MTVFNVWVWKDAKNVFPEDGRQVLCIKELANGRRTMCFGSHWNDRTYDNGWITSGGNNNVILWSDLPAIPENDGNVALTKTDPNSDLRDCVNELCLHCGQYHHAHQGACDGCRWLQVKKDLRK